MLAEGMVRSIRADQLPVVELGAGSGAITRCLVRQGIDEQQLVLVECNSYFATQLRYRFPHARVIQDVAQNLALSMFDTHPGVVVSSLPLMSMPNDRVEGILRSVFAVLRPGGRLIQFTYAPRCPVNRVLRNRLGLESELQEVVWRNVPPAGVYQLYRAGE
jgi:phospholipid N-methyltransferase